tara:strand:+ start:93878 stop:94114 length:237 start_codon:yes stop_codon:yes gene_type:complete
MNLLTSVIVNDKSEHVYISLAEQKGQAVISVAVHSRLSVDQWQKTQKQVRVAVERLGSLIDGLKKARQVAIARRVWNE